VTTQPAYTSSPASVAGVAAPIARKGGVRIKDVVKTGGEWVSSLDLEDIILRMPGIAEVAVVGVPDEPGRREAAEFVGVRDARHVGHRPADLAARRLCDA